MASRAWARVDPELVGGGVDRLAVQPSNTAFSPTARARLAAQLLRADVGLGCHGANWAARPARASPASRQPDQDQRDDDRRRAEPVERRQRLAIGEPAEQRRDRRLGQQGEADHQRRDSGRAHRPAGPGRSPGCRAPAAARRSSRAGMIRSPSASDERQQHRRAEQRWRGTASGSGCKRAARRSTAIR